MSFLNQEMTDHDLAAWTDDLLTRIELRVLMEHEVINHQGDDAAAAAWTALRRHRGEAVHVCTPERDEKGSDATIFY
jgi:hypothetical protein